MIIDITRDNTNVLGEQKVAIVKFYGTGCGPCKLFRGTYEKLAEANPVVPFYQLNIKDFENLQDANGHDLVKEVFNVQKIPAVIAYEYGEEVDRLVGILSRDAVQRMIDKVVE